MADHLNSGGVKPLYRRAQFYVVLAVLAGGAFATYHFVSQQAESAREDEVVRNVTESEELILTLTPKLKLLNESVLNLTLPSSQSEQLFAENVSVRQVRLPAASESSQTETLTRAKLDLFHELFETVDYFTEAKFYIERGSVTEPGVFESKMGFDGLARTTAGAWRSIHGSLEVTWHETAAQDVEEPLWQIAAWHGAEAEIEDRETLMFQDVLDLALPDAEVRADARKSSHEQHIIDQFRTGTARRLPPQYAKYFRPQADNNHPGLSVVDIDNDGWDDLYVTRRWDKNLLFHNQQDGTFREMAAEVGLDIEGTTACAIFADFDNDGDQDAFLGRVLERSIYLSNDDGTFVNHATLQFPYFVSSLSAADYDGDGLLDVYLCTYAIPHGELRTADDAAEFFPRPVVEKLWKKTQTADFSARYLNLAGPPNLLLKNLGNGRFAEAPENEQVEVWRTSLQATWADFDDDNDPDLYVANDYAPDSFFRNDGPDGFTEITRKAGGEAMMGFGMGATFGDFDLDGKQDLYVSNMFSKAGRRITAQVEGIDPRFVRSAEGNLLFRKVHGERYELVSGLEAPKMQVAKAGWSYGGQFGDLNNDGWLDLYVGSGYYTAPRAIASDIDL